MEKEPCTDFIVLYLFFIDTEFCNGTSNSLLFTVYPQSTDVKVLRILLLGS